jgi:GDP-4-dehydro-6-deoxy-D-mannose reductase
MSTILITGINGFVGKHLVRELVAGEHTVIGVSREEKVDPEISELLHDYVYQDIARAWPDISEPVDAVINLAGLAAVGPSFDQPQRYIDINSAIVTNIGEYYLKKDKKPRIVLVSSGAIYSPSQPMPLTEESKLGINSPYTISKVANETQAEYYRGRGLDIVIARPFNHIGPGQLEGFLVPDLIEKLKNLDDSKTLRVGSLTTKRDYTDVRDVARAYHLLATTKQLNHTIYNVCSGASHSGEEILAILQDIMGLKDVKVEIDQSKIRPNDPADIFGLAAKLTQDTGWKPEIKLEQTIKDSVYA